MAVLPRIPFARYSHHCVVDDNRTGTSISTKIPSSTYMNEWKACLISADVAQRGPQRLCARVTASPNRAKWAGAPFRPNGITKYTHIRSTCIATWSAGNSVIITNERAGCNRKSLKAEATSRLATFNFNPWYICLRESIHQVMS